MSLIGGSKSKSYTTNKAFNFNNLDYGQGGGSGSNYNLAESTVGDIISTDHGAVTSVIDLAGRVNQTNAELVMALGDRAYDDVEDSRELTLNLFGGAVDSVNSANREAMQFLNQNTDRALAFATQATRSEAGQIAENLTKYMMIGAAVLGGLIVLPRLKKG